MESTKLRDHVQPRILLSEEILGKLTCFLCEQFLYYFPIRIYPHRQKAACGRCPVLVEEEFVINTTLKALAPLLLLPCPYKSNGCVKKIVLSEMEAHEYSCPNRLYFCPVMPLGSCAWQGNLSEIINHFEEYHVQLILYYHSFELNLLVSDKKNYLLFYEGILLVYLNCDIEKDVISCLVSDIGNSSIGDKYCYQISLKSKSSSKQVAFPKQHIEDSCNTDMNAIYNTLKVSYIKKTLGDSILVSCIMSPSDEEVADEPKSQNFGNEFLFELECLACHCYMFEPIYQCVAGHSVCSNCRSTLQQCPKCNKKMSCIRNFTLEKLSSLAKIYCVNKNNGCSKILSSSEYKAHLTECQYEDEDDDCLFEDFNDCSWRGKNSSTFQHILTDHSAHVIESSCIIFFSLQALELEKMYVINNCDQLFRLLFKYKDDHFYWCLQNCEYEFDNTFSYELDIFNTSSNERFYLKRKCTEYVDYEDLENYVKVSFNLISHFIINETLTYKFQLLRIQNINFKTM